MTSCTPARPRCRRLSRNPRQNVSSSLSPTSSPRTSREPSAAIPVATTTALETTWEGVKRDVEVGRVEVDVGELGVLQRPGPERAALLVEPGADPRDLRLG